MKNIFKESNLLKVRDVTSVRPLTAEEKKLEAEAKEEEAKRPPTNEVPGKKGGPTSAVQAAAPRVDSSSGSYKSPNADKFVPDCVSIRTSPLATVSDLLDFIRYSASLANDNHFSLIFDDQIHEEIQSEDNCTVIDLGIGLGCEFILIKGCARTEKVSKIQHYANYFTQRGN